MLRSFKWWLWTRSLRWWADTEMDQLEMVRVETKFGTVYVSVQRSVKHSRLYDQIV
jgi:hypothetical protein